MVEKQLIGYILIYLIFRSRAMKKKKTTRKQHIFEDLARRIRNEEWGFGVRLPTREELAAEYSVSKITVIGALKLLEEENLIEKRQGSGSYVKWRRDNMFFPFLQDNHVRKIEVVHSLLAATPLYRFVMRQLAECFMKTYPDVRIRFLDTPASIRQEDPYIQKIVNADMPCCGEFFWHAIYAKLNALLPLENLPGFQTLADELVPQAFYRTSDASGEMHYHAVLQNLDLPNFILINRTWQDSLGLSLPEKDATWPQLFRMIRRSAGMKNGMYAAAFSLPQAWHAVKSYLEMMCQGIPQDSYAPNTPALISEILECKTALPALEILEELVSAAPERIKLNQPHEYFAIGKVGILPSASSYTMQLLSTMNSRIVRRCSAFPAIAPVPAYHPFYSGFSMGIFRDGIHSPEQLDAAWSWIKFLFCKQAQELCSQSMNLPVRRDAVPFLAEVCPDVFDLSVQMLEKSRSQPDFVGMRRSFSDLGNSIRALLLRKIKPKQCLEQMRLAVEVGKIQQ